MPKVTEEQLAATRRRILDGARRAFAQHGFEAATVKVLEQETGLSRGAIFHHFPDKDALFLALADEDAAEMARVVAQHGLVQVMRDLADRDPGWLGVQLEIARRLRTDPEFFDRWMAHVGEIHQATTQRLRRQQAAGAVRSDVPAERLSGFLQLVLDGLIAHLATGMPAADVGGVLDLVEAAVRQDSTTTPRSP